MIKKNQEAVNTNHINWSTEFSKDFNALLGVDENVFSGG